MKQDFADLSGQIALITGATKGIGKASSLALAQAGAKIILAARGFDDAKALIQALEAQDALAKCVQMDVSNIAESQACIDALTDEFGPIDILVNNAGGGIADMAIDIKPDDFDQVINLNVKSALFLSQTVAKHLIAAKKPGKIINVSSQAGLVALPTETSYCLAKAALTHMTKCLAVEWGEHGILVNAVCPTFIETPGTQNALSDPDFYQDTINRIAALKRIGKPEEVAAAIRFLASADASLITGHNLVIDGGWTIR